MEITPLAKKLKQLRKLNNFSQQVVADELNVIRQTYSHYETGRNYPNTETLYKLSKLYNVPLESLIKLSVVDESIKKYMENDENIYNSGKNTFEEKKLSDLVGNEEKLLYCFRVLDLSEQEDILNFLINRAKRKKPTR